LLFVQSRIGFIRWRLDFGALGFAQRSFLVSLSFFFLAPSTCRPRRSKRWKSGVARPEPKSSQNAQRNYERCLALARAEAQIGNTVGAENYYQYAEHFFRSMRARGMTTPDEIASESKKA